MKAQELRIGNYLQGEQLNIPRIQIGSDGICQITGYGIHLIEEGNSLGLKPILLTEEWLLDFGFGESKIDDSGIFSPCFKMMVQKDYVYGGFMFRYTIGEKSAGYAPIKYVHQLQNLYFALTGEDLIKR